jgi:excisionase family DNA binding protein
MTRTPEPSLDALAADPAGAASLEPATAQACLARIAGLLPLLLARIQAAPATDGAADPGPPRCLKPRDVAALTGLEEAYVHALCRAGRLPAFKTGKYWLIPVERFRAWQAAGGLDAAVPAALGSPRARHGATGPGLGAIRPRRGGLRGPRRPAGEDEFRGP